MDSNRKDELQALAGAVREACVQAALDGYEQAGMAGLCGEGRWEMAIDAMRSMDLTPLLEHAEAADAEGVQAESA